MWDRRLVGVIAGLVVLAAPLSAHGFSGEDPLGSGAEGPKGVKNWYHQALTFNAATQVGFQPHVAYRLAWHADYIDSYLYNYLFWAQGFPKTKRANRALANRPELEKLHFDDLTSNREVDVTWSRYLLGTLAGMLWAQERNDLEAARNMLAISMHAVQDFYSHSNWVDKPERRAMDWFATSVEARRAAPLFTGTYEKEEHLGVKPHGEIVPACTLLQLSSVRAFLNVGCGSSSPLTKSAVCNAYRRCKKGKTVKGLKLGPIKVPKDLVYLAPPGIALDNSWMSEIGIRERGLTDISGKDAFAAARTLAQTSTAEWLRRLEAAMIRVGAGGFFQRLKTEPVGPPAQRKAQYEDLGQVPWQFLSAGPYPGPTTPRDQEWYLRLKLRTSESFGSGTDADIVAVVDGKPFVLDYSRQIGSSKKEPSRVLAYNDFEKGDNDTYTIGPFSAPPQTLVLENRAPNALHVLRAFGRDFVNTLSDVVPRAAQFLRSLIGGGADHVATNKIVFRYDAAPGSQELLVPSPGSERPFSVRLNGGSEGDHEIFGSVKYVGQTQSKRYGAIDKYDLRLNRLHTHREATNDRGSDSDEPFILGVVNAFPGEQGRLRAGPYNDVDSGEARGMRTTWQLSVPSGTGMIGLAFSVWESDDESASERQQMLDQFAGRAEPEQEGEFLNTLGSAIAAKWGLSRVEAFAFNRAPNGSLQTGTVLATDVNRDVAGGSRVEFSLDRGKIRNHGISAHSLQTPTTMAGSGASNGTAGAMSRMRADESCPFVLQMIDGRVVLRTKRTR